MPRAFLTVFLAGLLSASPALSCAMFSPMKLEDIFLADAVVRGGIRSCEIVSDGYARFELGVGEVVAAAPGIEIVAGSRLAVTWVNSAFYLPDKLDDNYGRYLVALIAPGSAQPPLRGPSAFIAGPPEPGTYTILQAHCSDAFLFPADDLIAIALLQVLQTDRDQKRELQILSEFLFKNGASGVVKRKIFEAAHPRP